MFRCGSSSPYSWQAFRPEITSIIDVATRRIVGWSIDLSENKWAVLDAIRMSATECGIPAIFYVDNGSGYKNELLKGRANGILSRLNVTVTHALPYNSQAKGIIERSHRTLWVKAAKNLPTYMGKDMDAEAGTKSHKLTRSEIIKFGQAKA
ncbi:DDE-type integrase/transposase/recombinase [Acinetobacter vivianii]